MTQTTSPAPTPSGAFWQRFRDLGSLRRSTDHRAVAGVAEGLSRHFDVDPIIVRVLFAALTFFGGAGLILYLALWLTVPADRTGQSVISGRLNRDPSAWTTIGLAAGGIFAAAAFLGSLSWALPHPFPFLLIAMVLVFGVLALTRRGERAVPPPMTPSSPPTPPSSPSTAPSSTPPPATTWFPASSPAPTTDHAVETEPATEVHPAESTAVELTSTPPSTPQSSTELTTVLPAELTTPFAGQRAPATIVNPYPNGEPETAPDTASIPVDSRAWWQRDDPPPTGNPIPPFAVAAPAPRRPKSHLFGLTIAIIALAEGVVWIIDAASSTSDVNPSVYPGTALAIIAVALLAGAWWGRSRGLIALGVFASLVTAGAAFAGPGPYGDEVAQPRKASALQSSYDMGIGRFTLHLDQVGDIAALQGKDVTIDQHIGQLRVIIPSSVAATVYATVDHGDVSGARSADVVQLDQGGERALMQPDAAGRPAITLHLNLDYGEIRLERAQCPGAAPIGPGETTYLWQENGYVTPACN